MLIPCWLSEIKYTKYAHWVALTAWLTLVLATLETFVTPAMALKHNFIACATSIAAARQLVLHLHYTSGKLGGGGGRGVATQPFLTYQHA